MMPTKKELRRAMRLKKQDMDPEDIHRRSQVLCATVLQTDAYRQARSIYGYLPFNQEVQLLPLLEQALRDGKSVALPKCFGPEMRFIWVSDLTRVKAGSIGCPEPIDDGPVADDKTALVLVPGVAFDSWGYRIGYGGGYYDRFLQQEPDHPTVALCFDFQLVPHLETESHDLPVQTVFWV